MQVKLIRWRRLALMGGAGLLALWLLAWQGVPWAVSWALNGPVSAVLGRSVRVEQVRFNPLTWTLRLEGLAVAGATLQAPPTLQVAALTVDLSALSVLRGAPVVEGVELDHPQIRVARTGPGHYDLDDVLQRLQGDGHPTPAAPPGLPRFALHALTVSDGELDFDDQPVHHQHQVRHFQLKVPPLSTLSDADTHQPVRPELSLTLNGTPFDTQGTLTPFDKATPEQLQLHLKDLPLASWADYLPASVAWVPTQGRLSATLDVHYADSDGRLQLSGKLGLDELAVADRAGQPWAELGQARLDIGELDLSRRQVVLKSLELAGLTLHVRRDRQGQINPLPAGSAPPAAPASADQAAPTSSAAPAWALSLARFSGRDWTVLVDDAVPAQPLRGRLLMPQVTLQHLAWPLTERGEATALEMAFAWTDDRRTDLGQGRLQAQVTAKGGQATLALDQLVLEAWQPYLQAWLKPRVQGRLSTEIQAQWDGLPGEQTPRLTLPQLQLAQFRLNEAGGPGGAMASAASWPLLKITDVQVDPAQRSAQIGAVTWESPQFSLARDEAGVLNLDRWRAPAPVTPTTASATAPTTKAPAPAASPGWRVQLAQFQLSGGQIRWRDAAAGVQPVALDLQGLRLSAQQLHWPMATADRVPVAGEFRMAAPGAPGQAAGRFSWAGQAGPTPLSWRGRVQAQQLPLHLADAYLTSKSPVSLAHALATFRLDGQVQLPTAGPVLALDGDVRLDELQLNSRLERDAASADLLRWQGLGLQKMRVAMAPGQATRVELGRVELNEFFARLLVSPDGQLNLRTLGQMQSGAVVVAAAAPASTPAPAPASAQPPAAVADAASAPPLDLVVGGVQLRGGRIDFADRFVRPNYRTDLSDLNGQLGPFRSGSGEPATLSLSGKAAGTAALSIQGAFNPMAKPLALDIQARASDLELAPLTPYAAKYAGYAIERGKLTLDVNYRVQPDGKLQASNQLVLNQLTFGERVDSPDATQLPVQLAVALLTDRHGVIDLNLPISGSLNEPEFSVGRLVLKVLGNLLTKAVTAPFALLMGSGSDELQWVDFEPGTAQFTEAAAGRLDQVAQLLKDRAKLRLTVAGAADPQSERAALQAADLDARVQAAWRRQRTSAGSAAGASPAEREAASARAWREAPESERLQALQRVYADTALPDKPRNLLGLAKSLPAEEMQQRLQAAVVVSTDTARDLALRRGIAVRDALMARGLPNDRLFLAAPRLRASDDSDEVAWAPRVELKLAAP